MTDTHEDPDAPHGRDANGDPLAPYGYKVDGTPRKSNRGAAPGQKGNSGSGKKPAAAASPAQFSATDKKRVETIVGLVEMGVVMPLVGASMSPQLAKRLGPARAHHVDALAGDAVILSQFSRPLAEAVVVLGQTKPAALAWLDSVEEKAPYLMLAQVGIQLTKAIVGHHMNPQPRLNNAGRLLAQVRSAQIAEQIEAEARAYGIPTEVQVPQQRQEQEAA
jgi:hypothetical protein